MLDQEWMLRSNVHHAPEFYASICYLGFNSRYWSDSEELCFKFGSWGNNRPEVFWRYSRQPIAAQIFYQSSSNATNETFGHISNIKSENKLVDVLSSPALLYKETSRPEVINEALSDIFKENATEFRSEDATNNVFDSQTDPGSNIEKWIEYKKMTAPYSKSDIRSRNGRLFEEGGMSRASNC